MCAILDANMFGSFLAKNNEDMLPVRKWIEENRGKLAYSPTDTFATELEKAPNMKNLIYRYKQLGKLTDTPKEEVEKKAKELKGLIKSNDPYIIALAQVASVKLLISNDQALLDDFKNSDFIEQGKIYKYKKHKHLLRDDTCP